MSLISVPVKIHDILDAEGYVRAAIAKTVVLTPDERDELVAEGLAILCALAKRYDPHRTGYARPGSFAGYAANLLPRKLSDAYHRARENHVERTMSDGRRRYQYLDKASSYESSVLEGGRGSHEEDRFQRDVEVGLRHPGDFVQTAPPFAR